MSRTLERQRWFAALALAVAVPLPLTGIVSWPFLIPYLAVAAWVAASGRPTPAVPAWLENLLAPAILAAVVAAGGLRFGVLRPVAQLAVLVAAVRLPGSGQPGRARLAGVVLGVVGVAGIASSTHPTLAVYLVALLAFALVAVGRLIAVGLAEPGVGRAGGASWPPLRLVAASIVLAVLVAAPLFALLPRLRSPFAAAPFAGRSASGFREAIALHGLGDIKLSRRLVMKVRFPGVEPGRVSPDWLRLAGATMTHYRAGGWVEGRLRSVRVPARVDRPVALTARHSPIALRVAEIELESGGGTLFAPLGAAALEMHRPVPVSRDPAGTLRIPRGTELPLSYAVQFDPARVEQPPPDPGDVDPPPGAEALRELAERVVKGTTNPLAAALAIEQYLQVNYRYALRSNAPLREDPVAWFLFRSHEGHCEFFASSMVLLLRTIGIPARLQAGFAGAEPDGEGGYLVRDSHAHAWVLAFVGGRWRVFDPTPPEGRPGILSGSEATALRQVWEGLTSLWDRWVLTFSLADQVELVRRAAEASARALPASAAVLGGLVVLLLAARLARLGRARRASVPGVAANLPPISSALRRVEAAAAAHGVPVRPATTARAFAELALAAFPGSREPLAWLVAEHERSRYAGSTAPPGRLARRAARAAVRAIASGGAASAPAK